jgi:hypothetical protein
LGYWSEDRSSLVIASATPPSGRGSAFGVTIGAKGHQEKFDEIWDATDGAVTFVGDWHTHPGGSTRPSSTDRSALAQLAGDPMYGTPLPAIAVVGIPRPARLHRGVNIAFFLRTSEGQIHRLHPEPPSSGIPVGDLPSWKWPSRRQRRWK